MAFELSDAGFLRCSPLSTSPQIFTYLDSRYPRASRYKYQSFRICNACFIGEIHRNVNFCAQPRPLGYDIIGCIQLSGRCLVFVLALGSACQSHSILYLSVVLMGLGLAWRFR